MLLTPSWLSVGVLYSITSYNLLWCALSLFRFGASSLEWFRDAVTTVLIKSVKPLLPPIPLLGFSIFPLLA